MSALLVRIAKPGQTDHYVTEQRARELEADGWVIVTEASLTAPEQLTELALRVLSLQDQVDELESTGGSGADPRVDGLVTEVGELTQTVEAATPDTAPKPTPRTDALEAWRVQAEPAIAALQSTVAAIDLPAAVDAWLTANPPPAGAPGADGKSAYQIARDDGYGGTETQWLASLVGAAGVKGDKGDPGIQGPPGNDGAPGLPGLQGPAGFGFVATSKLAADHAPFTTTTLANVTGMSFPVVAATAYRFEFLLSVTSAATTTGWQFGLTGPASPTSLLAVCDYQSSATAWTAATLTGFGAFTLVTAAYAANTPILVRITGLLVNGTNAGTVQLQARSEVAGSAITVKRGSTLLVS